MTDTNTTESAEPVRSPARTVIAGRIAAVAKAAQRVSDLQSALDRLGQAGRDAGRLADDLRAAQARDAEAMAEWARAGGGDVPRLTDDDRLRLIAALAESEALAAAAVPAQSKIAAEVSVAYSAHLAAQENLRISVRPVVVEELAGLVAQIEDIHAKLLPLHARLAGLRDWTHSMAMSAGGETPHGQAFLAIHSQVNEAMPQLGIAYQTPSRGTDAIWGAFADHVLANPDATVGA